MYKGNEPLLVNTAVQTPDILSTALQGSNIIHSQPVSLPSFSNQYSSMNNNNNNFGTPSYVLGGQQQRSVSNSTHSPNFHTSNTGNNGIMMTTNSPGPALDEATALMFAAERGAVRSIQAWMARGGDINGTLVQQVRYFTSTFFFQLSFYGSYVNGLFIIYRIFIRLMVPFLYTLYN